mmetsp:Transcript_54458/g.65552  ORF Transcript_54458/g.65552 Transcript_54458/m.65552 type:complete len:171 (-) Transcript_54458:62-574(-)
MLPPKQVETQEKFSFWVDAKLPTSISLTPEQEELFERVMSDFLNTFVLTLTAPSGSGIPLVVTDVVVMNKPVDSYVFIGGFQMDRLPNLLWTFLYLFQSWVPGVFPLPQIYIVGSVPSRVIGMQFRSRNKTRLNVCYSSVQSQIIDKQESDVTNPVTNSQCYEFGKRFGG